MAVLQQGLSLEEFLKLPEEKPALEFEDGMVIQKVAPKSQHSVLQYEMAALINRFGRPQRLAYAFPELRATYGGRSYVPDVSVYRWERIPRDAAGEVHDDFRDPPDVVIEIVSPGQSVNSLVRRCLWYVRNGVQLALLVDPHDRSVVVFRPDSRASALRGEDRIDFGDVLPGVEIVVGELFESLKG